MGAILLALVPVLARLAQLSLPRYPSKCKFAMGLDVFLVLTCLVRRIRRRVYLNEFAPDSRARLVLSRYDTTHQEKLVTV